MASEHQIIILIERLRNKIDLLSGLYADAKVQIEQLERSNDALQTSLTAQQKQVSELQKKVDRAEKNTANSKDSGILVRDNPSDTDTNAKLKQQLDEYIRELERCITHLSSLS